MVSGQWVLQIHDWKQILVQNLRHKDSGIVKFADGIKSKIMRIGNVGKKDFDLITDVMLVEGLTHNLLSIS